MHRKNAYFQSGWRIDDLHFFLPSQEFQKRRKIQNIDILAVCNRYLLHCCCSFSFHSSWFCYFLFTFWFWILTPFLDNKFIPNDAPHFTLAVKRFVISNLILSKRLLWSEIQNCRQKSRCWLLEKSARMRESSHVLMDEGKNWREIILWPCLRGTII